MRGVCLVTGADGYVGSRLIAKQLMERDVSVVGWVRAASSEEFEQKSQRLASFLTAQGASLQRLKLAYGDLKSSVPFAAVDPQEITHLVHTAAITRFNVEEPLADQVNLGGSRKLFEFARTCRSLQHLQYVSTLYASGKQTGTIREARIVPQPEFANFYERSKWQSEDLLLREYGDLPWSIARVATVIADDESGHVSQFNAVHNTLKLLYYGLISIVPGNEGTPLYFVTGSFVSDALSACLMGPKDSVLRQIVHISHERSDSLHVQDLLDTVYEVFESDADFKRRGVLRPLLADETTFEVLASEMDSFQTGIVGQAMSSIRPFAKQLFVTKDIDNSRLRSLMPQYRAPDPRQLTRATTRYLAESKWGRK